MPINAKEILDIFKEFTYNTITNMNKTRSCQGNCLQGRFPCNCLELTENDKDHKETRNGTDRV